MRFCSIIGNVFEVIVCGEEESTMEVASELSAKSWGLYLERRKERLKEEVTKEKKRSRN